MFFLHGYRTQCTCRTDLRTFHAIVETVLLLIRVLAPELEYWRKDPVNSAFSDIWLNQLVWTRLHAVSASCAERVYALEVSTRRAQCLAPVWTECIACDDSRRRSRN